MRVGLIADIHGNAFALAQVLEALDRESCDAVYCLGDLVAPGPWPVEVAQTLRARSIPCVRGNTDEWILVAPETPVRDNIEMNESLTWARSRLSADHIVFLRELPMRMDVDLEETAVTLVHATPRSTTKVVSALTAAGALDDMFPEPHGSVVGGGHTHVQLLRNTNSMTMINPGSIGLGGVGPGTSDLPRSLPATGAEYAVVSVERGRSSVAFHHLDLDVSAMLESARETDMPHFEWWASLWAR